MTLNQLRAFQVVARHLNVTRAAREIQISQPVISKQLRLLEQEIGVKLHLTTGQGIRLTEQGHAFLNGVDRILSELSRLQLAVGDTARAKELERFVVGANDSSAAFLLPQALKTFHRTRPNVHPILRIGSSRAIEQMIINSEVEIGFTTNRSYDPRLIVETCRSDETVAFVSIGHPLALRRRLTRPKLSETPFVTRIGSKSVRQIEETGIQLKIVMECESSDAVKSAVEAGLGVGLLYRGSVEPGLRSGYFKSLTIPELQNVIVKCYLIYRKGKSLSTNAQYFLTILNQTGVNSKPRGETASE